METTPLLSGRYRLGLLIGKGGMGEVYEATDEQLGRTVAVKVLHGHLADRSDLRRRFATEARMAASLHHPNVVTIFDSGEDQGRPYLVMERLPGVSLADVIKRGPVPEAWMTRVAGEVLAAVAAAHAKGIIHRDLKPANILLCTEPGSTPPPGEGPICKVADFGIAKLIEGVGAGADTTTMIMGTPAYLAPEQAKGKAGTRSDLYAFGVVLYEALAGERPDPTPRPLAEVRPGVSPHLAAAVHRAMALEPSRRFASANQMAASIVSATRASGPGSGGVRPGPTPTVALPERARGRASGPPIPLPVLIGAVLAVAVMVVLGTAAFSAQRDKPASPSLVEEMRALVPRLGPEDGEMAPEAGRRLGEVADAAADGSGGEPATALLADVLQWRREGRLGPTATSKLTALLVRVPGVSVPTTTTATTAPPKDDDQEDKEEDNKGKGKGNDD